MAKDDPRGAIRLQPRQGFWRGWQRLLPHQFGLPEGDGGGGDAAAEGSLWINKKAVAIVTAFLFVISGLLQFLVTINCQIAKFFLNAEQLVVFGHAVGAAQ